MAEKMNFSDIDLFSRGDSDSGSEYRSPSPEVPYQGASLRSGTGVDASQGDHDHLQTPVRRVNGGLEGMCCFVTCLGLNCKLCYCSRL